MLNLQQNIPLKNYTTFKIGGPAKFFIEIKDLNELTESMNWAKENRRPFFVFSGGSNLLFSDAGYDGLVIKIFNRQINFATAENLTDFQVNAEIKSIQKPKKTLNNKEILIYTAAGNSLADLVKFSSREELTGLEWAAGIPGSVGGATVGNAGAFGGEIKDCILKVRAFDTEKSQIVVWDKTDCAFDYRESLFKSKISLIIWDALIILKEGNSQEIKEKITQIIQARQEKQPPLGQFPSAGSVFKNPLAPAAVIELFEKEKNLIAKNGKVPAGWLIEKAGLKGVKIGGAAVSELQANFIVNLGDASAQDVLDLIRKIKSAVREKFQIDLEEEICLVKN